MKQTRKTISKTLIAAILVLVIASVATPIAYAKHDVKIKVKEDGFILQERMSKDVIRFIEIVPLHMPEVPEIPEHAFYTVNVYAIDTGKSVVLIDCGTEGLAERLYDRVKHSFGRKPIMAVLLTHGHADHAGGGAYFQNKGAKVYVGAGDLYMVMYGNPWSPYDDFSYTGYSTDYTYEEKVPPGFMVIPTPGHTDGSASILYKGKNLLFTGDTSLSFESEDKSPLDMTYELDANTLAYMPPEYLQMQLGSLNTLMSTLSKKTVMCPGHKGVYKSEQAKLNILTTIGTINFVLNPLSS